MLFLKITPGFFFKINLELLRSIVNESLVGIGFQSSMLNIATNMHVIHLYKVLCRCWSCPISSYSYLDDFT